MKRLLIALTLTCAFSISAFAADIPTCGITSTGPDGASPGNIPTSGSTSPGDMPTCGWSLLLSILDLTV